MSSFASWLKGILAAAIGGASNSIIVIGVDPQHFNFADGIGNLAGLASVGALLAVAGYLAKSPVWGNGQQK
ncbi:MAG: hypothetical protein L0220_16165 [Acidobacteria bacterium]|nr:hypothetical protein [Acidobacteriota bacterium]